ncbi:hypothetical protein Lal_00011440, partial [Lupinus albus]
MIGNVTPDFNALIKVGSRIEQSLKSGKIEGDQLSANEGKSLSSMIKEEWETNFLADGRKYKKPKHHHQNPYSKASYAYQTSYPYIAFLYHILSQFPKHSPNTNQIHWKERFLSHLVLNGMILPLVAHIITTLQDTYREMQRPQIQGTRTDRFQDVGFRAGNRKMLRETLCPTKKYNKIDS